MFDLTFNVDDKGVATPLTLEIRQAVIAGSGIVIHYSAAAGLS